MTNSLSTHWRAEALQFKNRPEVIRSLLTLAKSDVWYSIGTPIVDAPLQITANLFRKPRVVHWVGSDIAVARDNPSALNDLRHPYIKHLTEVEWEQEELRAMGIDAAIAPLPPRFLPAASVPALPVQFTVLTYLPHSRTDFYGRREIELVVRAFRGQPVRFLIVGGGSANFPPDAPVENVGWSDSLVDIFERSSVLVRFTPRDGLSLMVLEALAFGRYVLWTKGFQFVRQVSTVEGIVAGLNELLRLNQQGELKPQLDAAQFVRTAYDRGQCLGKIVSAWESACLKKQKLQT